jgi:hypothetical protein
MDARFSGSLYSILRDGKVLRGTRKRLKMTTNANRLNTTNGMTVTVFPKASENGMNVLQRLAALFSARRLGKSRVYPYSFSDPQNQKTYLSFHRTMW